MPSKYPVVKPEKIIDYMQTKGFRYVSQKGSHRKYTNGKCVVIVPMHSELAKGTLKSILAQAEISIEEFCDYLK